MEPGGYEEGTIPFDKVPGNLHKTPSLKPMISTDYST